MLKGKEENDNLIKEKLHNWTSLEDKWLAYKKHLLQVITYENNLPRAHNANSFDLIVHFVNQYSKQNIYLFLVSSVHDGCLISYYIQKWKGWKSHHVASPFPI